MASKKPSGLGRGLGALLGDDVLKTETTGALYLPITDVESNSSQPRKNFDEEALAQLADSIREHGIIQPLTVRKLTSGYYQIIAGERRWRAARMAGLKEVPVTVIEADDRKAAELAMIENLQREDLDPIEEAMGYRSLTQQYHMTQEEAAQRVGKSRSAVTNALRLLELEPSVQKKLQEKALSAGHARALIPLSPALQVRAANAIIDGGLSVRQAEALAKRLAAEKKPRKETPVNQVDYTAEAQKELSSKLGRGVRIVTGRKKGRIELEYYGLDDLNDLLEAAGIPAPQEEKTSQGGNKPVVVYIMILFIAAFLLMALSFFMHQRSNTEALGELQNSVSTMQEVQATQEKIIDLQDKLAVAEEELDRVNEKLEKAEQDYAASEKSLQEEKDALLALYALQQNYLNQDFDACVQTIQEAESAGLPAKLSAISETGLTAPAVRWQQLKSAVEAKAQK